MPSGRERHFWLSVARGCGGAIIFSFPLLMTMEMWWLGFTMPPSRLILLVAVTTPLLALVSYYSGFDKHHDPFEAVLDAFVAWVIGLFMAFLILGLTGVITSAIPLKEIVGKCLIQAVPASLGAVFARTLLGGNEDESQHRKAQQGVSRELALRAIGALLLGFTAAPTEEMVLISYRMSKYLSIGLMLVSLCMLHGFVYGTHYRDKESQWGNFFRLSIPGYCVACLVSAYVLWSFGRLDGMSLAEAMQAVVVLSFPAALGAGAVRLIL